MKAHSIELKEAPQPLPQYFVDEMAQYEQMIKKFRAGEIGETSIVESLNTTWRQRQSGLVRRSCGVSRRIETDLVERFFLLVEQHNRACQRRWECKQKTMQSGQ